MAERLAVAAPQSSREPRQAAASRTPAGPAQQMLDLQRSAGNALARQLAPDLGPPSSANSRLLARCGGGRCGCGGACGGHAGQEELEEELTGASLLRRAVAARQVLAREETPDPGPPQPPDVTGLSCGFRDDGSFYCTLTTKAGDMELDPQALTPQQRQAAQDPLRKDCPIHRWNTEWRSCCIFGKHFDPLAKKCVPDPKPKETPKADEPPFEVPPKGPDERGDYPLPAGDPVYA